MKSATEASVAVPTIVFSTVKIPQPDGGVLFKPGKAQEVGNSCSASEAAKMLGISERRMQYLCQTGNFKTAFKPGGTTRSNWRVMRSEVVARLLPADCAA